MKIYVVRRETRFEDDPDGGFTTRVTLQGAYLTKANAESFIESISANAYTDWSIEELEVIDAE